MLFHYTKVVLITAFLLSLAIVHAIAQTTSVDLNPVADQVTSVITDIILGLLFIVALWAAMIFKQKTGIDVSAQILAIEAKHRDTLHSAATTWANAARAKYGPNLDITTNNAALAFVLNGVKNSAPDAIKALGASDAWITAKVAGLLGVPATAVVVQ